MTYIDFDFGFSHTVTLQHKVHRYTKMKKKSLGAGHSSVLAPRHTRSFSDYPENQPTFLSDLESPMCRIAVLRTKGGSGEFHGVKLLYSELSKRGKGALIIRRNPDPQYEIYSVPAIGSLPLLATSSDSPLNVEVPNWQPSSALIAWINSSPTNALVFTLGRDSQTTPAQLDLARELCTHIFLTVAVGVQASLDSARRLASSYSSNTSHKLFLLMWKRLKGNHCYEIHDADSFSLMPTSCSDYLNEDSFGSSASAVPLDRLLDDICRHTH